MLTVPVVPVALSRQWWDGRYPADNAEVGRLKRLDGVCGAVGNRDYDNPQGFRKRVASWDRPAAPLLLYRLIAK